MTVKKLTDAEVEKNRLLKIARSNIRLKHATAADAELNEVIPALEAEIDENILWGREFHLDLDALLEQ